MKKTSPHSHKTSAPKSTNKTLLRSASFGAVCALCTLLLMILASCAICLAIDYPHRFIAPLCFFCLYSASFIGGLFSVKRNGGSALLCGSLTGVIITIILWIIFSLLDILWLSDTRGFLPLLLKLLIIPVSTFGAIIGTGSGKARHKRPNNF